MANDKTMAEVIQSIVTREIEGIHTTQLGRVVAVGETTIDVQPVIKKVMNGSIIDMPLFKDVPPIFMQGGSSFETWPIAVGDYCLLFIAETCIDRWYLGEDDQAPNEDRHFDYSDSFALVGINPLASAKTIPEVITSEGDKHITGNYTHIGNTLQTGDTTQTGNVIQIGNYTLTGTLNVTGDIVLNGVSLSSFVSSHTHGGVTTGVGNTAVPN